MKCAACGYGYYWDSEKEEMVGNQDFIQLRERFTFKEGNAVDGMRISPVLLFACPKCKTIVMKEEV